MIAKRPFRTSFVRRRKSNEGELRLGCEPVLLAAEWIAGRLQFLSGKQRCEHQLRHVFRQRSDSGENQRWWSTKKHSHRQWLIETLRFRIMKPAACLNLPMQSGRALVIDLHAI